MNRSRALLLLLALALPAAATAEVTALVGATVHPVSGPDIPNGVVVFDGAKITAVGAAGAVTVPPGAKVIQVSGKHVYPGFVAALNHLGLVEVGSVRGSTDVQETGENNANLRSEVAVNADSMLMGPAMAGGVLYAHIAVEGGVVSGRSAVIRLHGWNWTDMTVKAPIGVAINYPRVAQRNRFFRQSEEDFDKEKEKAIKNLQAIIDGARAYDTARQAMLAKKGPAIEIDPRFEAMMPLIEGQQTVFLKAPDKATIEAALDWAKREKLTHVVLIAGADAQLVTERLVKEKIPVILDGVLDLPERRWDPYDAVYAAAGALAKAGVTFAIADGGDDANVRNLPFHAAMAVAFGLPREAAVRSVTLAPAEILGVADRIGSLAAGKEASLFVVDGDPLEMRSHIERVWVAGDEIDVAHERQRMLYERYKSRPKPTATAPH